MISETSTQQTPFISFIYFLGIFVSRLSPTSFLRQSCRFPKSAQTPPCPRWRSRMSLWKSPNSTSPRAALRWTSLIIARECVATVTSMSLLPTTAEKPTDSTSTGIVHAQTRPVQVPPNPDKQRWVSVSREARKWENTSKKNTVRIGWFQKNRLVQFQTRIYCSYISMCLYHKTHGNNFPR